MPWEQGRNYGKNRRRIATLARKC